MSAWRLESDDFPTVQDRRREGRFRGSVLGGADKADVGLSFVVPQVKLILGDLARIENPPRQHRLLSEPIVGRLPHSQRKTFADSAVQTRNTMASAATSLLWVHHPSPFQIP